MIVSMMREGCVLSRFLLLLLLSLSLLFLLLSLLSPCDPLSSLFLRIPFFCQANGASDSATPPKADTSTSSSSSSFSPSLSEPDTVVPFPLKRLAFGSCFMTYHQRRRPLWQKAAVYVHGKHAAIEEEWRKKYEKIENEVWNRISDENPTAWIWLGDAGYSRMGLFVSFLSSHLFFLRIFLRSLCLISQELVYLQL